MQWLIRVKQTANSFIYCRGAMQATAGFTRYSTMSYHPQGPKGDMLKYQSSLPKLPVPPLQQSLQKYLKAMQPLLNEEDFKKTCRAVEEFGKKNGVGEELQKALEERAKTCDNWLADWWLHVAYLSFRESTVINSNPCSMFTCPFVNQQSFIHYTMRMVVAMAKFLLIIRSENLPVEKAKTGPLCMSQYLDMLSCCRIPGKEVDTLRRSQLEESCHVIVAHNDHFFSLEILSQLPDGTYALVPPQHIEEQLRKIVESSPTKAQYPVGVLTSENRVTWCNTREKLLCDPLNRSSLDIIERGQFIVYLDPPHPGVDPNSSALDTQLSIVGGRALHGNGTGDCSCNRWFDHGIQSYTSPDGFSGYNLEHSAADGTAAIQITLYCIANVRSENLLDYKSPVPPHQLTPAHKLQWNISPDVDKDIEVAKAKINRAASDCDLQVFIFKEFGKEFVKSHKQSPDSFLQVAIQLAYYKMYGHLTATYESAATRQFLRGRTDTIRACSVETLAFCKAALDPAATNKEKAAKLKTAMEAHRNYTIQAVSGNVFDRHLLGLKILASAAGIKTPSLFTDPSFAKCFHFSLSTSQMSSDYMLLCGFGAVVPDGYGICYNLQKEQILLAVSTYKSCSETDTTKFGAELFESMRKIKNIFESQTSATKL